MNIDPAAAYLSGELPRAPRIGVVLGSGLGDLNFGPPERDIPYLRIPGFPRPRVAGHPGRLTQTGPVAVLRGRVHFYEGHSMEEVTRPVRVLARLGIKTLILTNAAGGVNPRFKAGDLMLVSDHLNLMGENPLRGGPRFVDLSEVYDSELRKSARRMDRLREGVYAAVAGPSYETLAEVRMLRKLGADAVGMSTVPEAVAAREEGVRVVAISVIANAAAGVSKKPVRHADVLAVARQARDRMEKLLCRMVEEFAGSDRL